MNANWPIVTIKDIAADLPNALSTGPFGSAISSKFFTDSGVPVIRGSNLSTNINNRLKDKGLVFVSEEKAKGFSRSVAKVGDLIFTCWGTINQVGFIDGTSKWSEYIISNKQMKLTVNKELADPRFVYYLFSSPQKQNEILSNAIGAAVPGFNLGQLKKHELKLPPLALQRKISDFLDVIDKKITLNTQTNQTLEALAQALFKSWFVDFDPVKAKMRGEQPVGMDAGSLPKEIAALFPDQLIESELGLIPDGWVPSKIKDIVNRLKPKKRYTKKQVETYGEVPVFEQGASIVLGFHNEAAGFSASPEEPVFIFGDHTCITHLSCSEFDISQNVIPIDGLIRPTVWTYYAIQGKQEFQEYRRHWSEFIVKDICLAPEPICQIFTELVTKKLLLSESLKRQSNQLQQLRDTLLPKLLSGELSL